MAKKTFAKRIFDAGGEFLLEQVRLNDRPADIAKNIGNAVSKLMAFKNNLEEISK